MDVQIILKEYGLEPDITKDQHFLIDKEVVELMVAAAELDKQDVVLEVGAGVGNLTERLAERAGRVIAFEIDPQFAPVLEHLPKNVEVHLTDAWEYVQLQGKWYKKREFNKVVADLPYSFCEQFLHNLTFLNYDKVVLLLPKSFAEKISTNGVFDSFFTVRIIAEVSPAAFYPIPKTQSVVIELCKRPDPATCHDLGMYLRRYLYQHEDQKVKNSLREGFINYMKEVNGEVITKNKGRDFVAGLKLSTNYLEEKPSSQDVYFGVSREIDESSKSNPIWGEVLRG